MELFLAFLAQHDDGAWCRTIDRLQRAVHPVDRVATRIWFHFFPLALDRAMTGHDAGDVARRMSLAGRWRLADQIDSSHSFLYGHQYWPSARQAVLDFAGAPRTPGSLDLGAQIQEMARAGAAAAGVDASLLVGITAVALRTLQQVGPEVLAASRGETVAPGAWDGRGADDVLAARNRQDSQGPLGFLRGARRQWSVVFDERSPARQFPLIDSQHLTTAASLDRRDYRSLDARCSQGPIPVQCRSCSCGTCWVGVVGGSERLSPMETAERDKLAECGYIETAERHPPIRLACQAQAFGRVSLVIPSWNGVLSRGLKTR